MDFQPYTAIVGPTYSLPSLNAECQRCVNLFLEGIESGKGANNWYLTNTPGLSAPIIDFNGGLNLPDVGVVPAAYPYPADWGYTTGMTYSIQNIHTTSAGRVFFISGNCLFELINEIGYEAVFLGNLCPASTAPGGESLEYSNPRRFQITETSLQLWIMLDRTEVQASFSDTTGFGLTWYDLTEDSSGAFPYVANCWNSPSQTENFWGVLGIIAMNDQLITIANAKQLSMYSTDPQNYFQFSPFLYPDLNPSPVNPTWGANDITPVSRSPDAISGMVTNGTDIWFFGPYSYEVFYNPGDDPNNPFRAIPGAAGNIGCNVYKTINTFVGKVFWLGYSAEGANTVWMSNGYLPVRISTIAIENDISSFTTVDDAIAWSYHIPGHSCYVISFPTGGKTYVYDLEIGQWHELSYRDPVTTESSAFPISCQSYAFGSNIVGDLNAGKLYLYSTNYLDYAGAPAIKYRRTPGITQGRRLISYRKLELEMETGVGTVDTGVTPAPTSVNPLLSLRWSNDSAKTWGNYHVRSMGKAGEYSKRVVFNNLGQTSQRRVFEIYVDAAVKVNIVSAEVGLDIGIH